MFGSFGRIELLLILFIVLIIFGAGKRTQLGEWVGKAIKGFKRSVNEAEPTTEDAITQGKARPTTPVHLRKGSPLYEKLWQDFGQFGTIEAWVHGGWAAGVKSDGLCSPVIH